MAAQVYKPGESVPESGVYRVVHGQHRSDHEATLFSGEQFAGCAVCGQNVRFELLRKAVPIRQDRDFKQGAGK